VWSGQLEFSGVREAGIPVALRNMKTSASTFGTKTGRTTYKLNYIPCQGSDTENSSIGIGNQKGEDEILEHITLTGCDRCSGWFTLNAYDPSGNQVAQIVGVLKATRVTVNTKIKDLL